MRLLDAIGNGATASDSSAALLLRLVLVLINRVSALERKARDHNLRIDKLSKPVLSKNAPGIEGGRNGAAVRPERDSAPAWPAPRPGRKDSPPRKRLLIGTGWRDRVDYERAHTPPVLDADWDG
jgi:hypothetical protein